MKVIIVAILYGLFFGAIELISTRTKLKKEVSRKTIHILAGISAAFLPFYMPFRDIVYLGLLFTVVMLVSKKANIFKAIHGVKRTTYGEVYFPLALAFISLIFPEKPIYMYGMLIMAISDGLASIIGQKLGKAQYKLLSGHKTYVGSSVFFLSALVIGLIIMPVYGAGILASILISVLSAGVLTFIEGCLSSGLDNLLIPPATCGLILGLLNLFSQKY